MARKSKTGGNRTSDDQKWQYRITDYSVVASVAPRVVHMVHGLDVQAVSNCHIRTATLNVVLTQNRFGFCVGLPYLESSAAADTKCCVDTKNCVDTNVVSKFWYTADCGPHVAQITGKLWQWLSGSTPRPKRAANGLLAVPWCRELKNAVPDQQLVQGLFRNTFWANLGQFGCSGSLFGVFLCVPEQFHRYKANFAYHTDRKSRKHQQLLPLIGKQ